VHSACECPAAWHAGDTAVHIGPFADSKLPVRHSYADCQNNTLPRIVPAASAAALSIVHPTRCVHQKPDAHGPRTQSLPSYAGAITCGRGASSAWRRSSFCIYTDGRCSGIMDIIVDSECRQWDSSNPVDDVGHPKRWLPFFMRIHHALCAQSGDLCEPSLQSEILNLPDSIRNINRSSILCLST